MNTREFLCWMYAAQVPLMIDSGEAVTAPPFHFEDLVMYNTARRDKNEIERFGRVMRQQGWCIISLPHLLKCQEVINSVNSVMGTFFGCPLGTLCKIYDLVRVLNTDSKITELK